MLTLRKLSQAEFDEWFALSTQRQAEDRAWASGRAVLDELKDLEAMVPHFLPRGMNTPGHLFRLAQDANERIVAFVWFGLIPGMPDTTRFLFDIYVVPEARRNGYASDVLRTMMHRLRVSGIRDVALNVLNSNVGGIALYESLGFASIEEREHTNHLEMRATL